MQIRKTYNPNHAKLYIFHLQETARKIDREISNLIKKAYKLAKSTLEQNVDILHALAERLLEKETVMGKELDELIRTMKPGFEFPSKSIEMEAKDKDTKDPGETSAEKKAEAETEAGTEPKVEAKAEAADE